MAIWVVRSRASISAVGTPYSACRSKLPARPARRMTSEGWSIETNWPLPSSPFTSLIMFLRSIRLRKRSGMRSMNCSPRRMRRTFSGSIRDLLAPGNPRPVPLITIEPSGVALRSKGCGPLAVACGCMAWSAWASRALRASMPAGGSAATGAGRGDAGRGVSRDAPTATGAT